MLHQGRTIEELFEAAERVQREADFRKTAGSDWYRFLHPGEPEDFDHDREAEFED